PCDLFFFSHYSAAHRALHSFPTRRSSDLTDRAQVRVAHAGEHGPRAEPRVFQDVALRERERRHLGDLVPREEGEARGDGDAQLQDRKSTRLNSSHSQISYAVFCLKKKTNK